MNEIITLFRGALTLDAKKFGDLKAAPDVFRKGFLFVVVVGLIVGIVLGLVATVQGLTTSPAAEIAQARQQMESSFGQFMPPEAAAQFLDSFNMGMRIAERIAREKALLPRPVEVVFKQIGFIVAYPFGWLGSLLLYGAFVHIFAKLLGGRGTIAQMFGVTSLAVAPHLLDALGFIPCLGGLLGLIAFVWGAVIYVKGTATAQELSAGRATLAVFMPIVVAFVLAVLLLLGFGVLIALASGGR